MDKNVIFCILTVVKTRNNFFWTCGFLQMIKNSLNCLNLQYKKIWKILKLKKWTKMSFFAYWRSSKREIIFFWHAVFASCSEMFQLTFWPSFIEILRAIFEKKSKNHHFDHIFVLYGWTNFFFQNRASSLFFGRWFITSCKKS